MRTQSLSSPCQSLWAGPLLLQWQLSLQKKNSMLFVMLPLLTGCNNNHIFIEKVDTLTGGRDRWLFWTQPVSGKEREKHSFQVRGHSGAEKPPGPQKFDAYGFFFTSSNFQELRMPCNQHHRIAEMTSYQPLILYIGKLKSSEVAWVTGVSLRT